MSKDIKDIEEILELAKEEIENNDENITATLDLQDLKSLKKLYDLYQKEKEKNKELENADLTTVYMNGFYDGEKKWKDKIKEELTELDNMKVDGELFTTAVNFAKKILQELLQKCDKNTKNS